MSEASLPLTLDRHGLVPVIVQDRLTGEIRMVAHATVEAVRATIATGRATFWSHSRGELWEKGRTSGNPIFVSRVLVDCDSDCLVYSSDPQGPSCHTGAVGCFFRAIENGAIAQKPAEAQTILARLEGMLEARKASPGAEGYGGARTIGEKIRERAGELAQSISGETASRVTEEAADLVYQLMTGLRYRNVAWRDVLAVLEKRVGASGTEGKDARSSTSGTGGAR